MPKMTLLDMTQRILSSIGGQEVNSINDSGEADDVVFIIKDTYYALVTERLWPQHRKLRTLDASTDNQYPCYLRIPDNVVKVVSLSYNVKDEMSDATGLDKYKELKYLEPDVFLDRMYTLDPAASNVITKVDTNSGAGVKMLFINDKDPEFWTSFDDEWIITDSYDSSYDDTLQTQKTLAKVYEEPAWEHDDNFIPDMPQKAFPYLLAEAKKVAAIEIKQAFNPAQDERARRLRTWLAGEKKQTGPKGFGYPGYGRK